MALAVITLQRGGEVRALGRPPQEVASLGSPPLTVPAGVAHLPNGSLAVTDARGGAVAIESEGAWTTYGFLGTGSGHFRQPAAIAVSPDAVYVADTGNDRIVRLVGLGPDGVPAVGWAAVGSTGRPGPADPGAFRFARPSGVAADGDTVLAADTGNGRLVAFPTSAFDIDPPTGWRVVDLPAGPVQKRPFGVARRGQGWAVSDVANASVHFLDETLAVEYTLRTDRLRLGVPSAQARNP
jgi:sugar lactone lactonase YvrE